MCFMKDKILLVLRKCNILGPAILNPINPWPKVTLELIGVKIGLIVLVSWRQAQNIKCDLGRYIKADYHFSPIIKRPRTSKELS